MARGRGGKLARLQERIARIECAHAWLLKTEEIGLDAWCALHLIDRELYASRPIAILANLRLLCDRLDVMRAAVDLAADLAADLRGRH